MKKSAKTRDGVSRRDFLAVGGMGLMGLSVRDRLAEARRRGRNGYRSCVLLVMNGGPSQFETFDPKPDAPREIRGPLRAISTGVPGVSFCESLPELALRADRLTVLRSLHHDAAPVHETGCQLLLSGRLHGKSPIPASVGARLATSRSGKNHDVPAYVLLGGTLARTGTSASVGDLAGASAHSQGPLLVDAHGRAASEDAALTGASMTDIDHESTSMQDRYGDSRCGRLLLQARQLVEQGVGFIAVNMFDGLEGERTWDAHGCPTSAPATLFDYQNWLGPQFDRAVAALLDDLTDRRLLESTLVVCCGEFGRTPLVNAHGGREHWTQGFSGILFGGDSEPGVIGATTRNGGDISDSPTELAALPARMAQFLKLPAVEEAELASARPAVTPNNPG